MTNLLVVNAEIFTLDSARPYIEEGAIAIEGNTIVAVGKSTEVKSQYKADMVIDAKRKVLMPGLVNGHDHFEQSFMKGLVRVYPETTARWIKEFKIPLAREFRAEDYYYSNLISCLEMIHNGVTCGVNSVCQQDPKKTRAFGLEQTVRAAEETGVRELVAVAAADKFEPDDFLLSPDEASSYVDWAIAKWNHTSNDRIRVWTGLGLAVSTSPTLWKEMRGLAEERRVGLHMHIGSVGTGEIEAANQQGNLGPQITGAHCVWLTDHEIELMAKAGVKAVHCPTYKLSYSIDSKVSGFGDGIAPITQMVRAGVTTGLGSDGCMGDTKDLFREMRNLAFTQHYKMRDKTLFPPTQLLQMATTDCAKTMDWQDEIGSIKVGKKADLIVVDKHTANATPWANPSASLVYLVDGHDVETVIIDGKVVMKERRVVSIDEEKVMAKANGLTVDLVKRAGMESLLSEARRLDAARLPNG